MVRRGSGVRVPASAFPRRSPSSGRLGLRQREGPREWLPDAVGLGEPVDAREQGFLREPVEIVPGSGKCILETAGDNDERGTGNVAGVANVDVSLPETDASPVRFHHRAEDENPLLSGDSW